MRMDGGMFHRNGIIAAFFVLTALALGNSAQADPMPTNSFAPVETPKIDADLLKPPQTARQADIDKFQTDRSDKAATRWTAPKVIDLGTYQLQFDANHTSAITAPHFDMDSGENANLSNLAPGKRNESILPNYFGFKLSAPTH
jgi:hypothetical protein